MDDQSVLRITLFRPRDRWHELDRSLRELMPSFGNQHGLLQAWVGRHGPASGDERIVVSVWATGAAEAAAMTMPEILDRLARPATDIHQPVTRVYRIRIHEDFQRDQPPRILRLFRGVVRPGGLEAYLAEAAVGTRRDGARANGLASLVCATDGHDGFVTASVWCDWSAIEAATGGDVTSPQATRHAERAVSGAPEHFELIGLSGGPTGT